MSDFEAEIKRLRGITELNRRQFLRAEVQTCFIALDRARYELSLGNTHEAEKEFAAARRGTQVIEKFSSESPGPLPEIESKLKELKASLEALRAELDSH